LFCGVRMPKLTLDGIVFNTEDLSETACAELASLQFLDKQMSNLDQEIAVLETVVSLYTDKLHLELSKNNKEPL
jgi:hypothetical protein